MNYKNRGNDIRIGSPTFILDIMINIELRYIEWGIVMHDGGRRKRDSI